MVRINQEYTTFSRAAPTLLAMLMAKEVRGLPLMISTAGSHCDAKKKKQTEEKAKGCL